MICSTSPDWERSGRPLWSGLATGHEPRSTTMSILGNIMSSIFGSAAQAAPAQAAPASTAPAGSPAASAGAGKGNAAPISQVDVAATMDKLASASKEDLDWRRSIVDLMKLLGLDSSL